MRTTPPKSAIDACQRINAVLPVPVPGFEGRQDMAELCRGIFDQKAKAHYDLNGRNVSGPPPRPLDLFDVHVRGDG